MKKFLSIFLVILILFCSIPFSSSAAQVDLYGDIDSTSVEADLKKMGHKFEDYAKDSSANYCRLIDFLEYSYEYDGSSENYGLFVYLYNPSGKKINTSTATIKMQGLPESNNVNDGSGLKELTLIYCDSSTSSGYENVFYKFKIGTSVKQIHPNVSRDMRHYQIDSVSFAYSGVSGNRIFEIGGRYSFIGYMPYCDKAQSPSNTLEQMVTDVTAVDIELHPVTWKTETSDKGTGYKYCMYSVYFAIPNDIIDTYGYQKDITKGLREIRGEYEEYKINGIITKYSDVYNTAYKYMNRSVPNEGNSDIPIYFATRYSVTESSLLDPATKVSADKLYNFTPKNRYEVIGSVDSFISRYSSVFLYDGSEFSKLSVDQITYGENGLYDMWEDRGFMHMGTVDSGSKLGYQMYKVKSGEDLTKKIATYASANTKFQAWLKGERNLYIEDEVYDKAESIEAITSVDANKTDKQLAADLFMEEEEVADFKHFVNEANANNKTTFIMRFAVRDYYCAPAYVKCNGTSYGINTGNHYYEMTIFRNLDIFTFEFEDKYQKRTIIPVICEPVDVIPSIEQSREPEGSLGQLIGDIFNPTDGADRPFWEIIKIILLVIAGLSVFALLAWILNKLGFSLGDFLRAIGNCIMKFLRWIVKWIKIGWRKLIDFFRKKSKKRTGKGTKKSSGKGSKKR